MPAQCDLYTDINCYTDTRGQCQFHVTHYMDRSEACQSAFTCHNGSMNIDQGGVIDKLVGISLYHVYKRLNEPEYFPWAEWTCV